MNDRSLTKDKQNGVIAGVCAGLARFFGIEIWLVRILTVSALLLGG
ncbi:MAG: PspC domain-containing protein, partial [Vibrio sp.]